MNARKNIHGENKNYSSIAGVDKWNVCLRQVWHIRYMLQIFKWGFRWNHAISFPRHHNVLTSCYTLLIMLIFTNCRIHQMNSIKQNFLFLLFIKEKTKQKTVAHNALYRNHIQRRTVHHKYSPEGDMNFDKKTCVCNLRGLFGSCSINNLILKIQLNCQCRINCLDSIFPQFENMYGFNFLKITTCYDDVTYLHWFYSGLAFSFWL